ncbi:MAG TPA: N-acetylglucosamine-6-phosphate deacetylase [Opitutaceae bacterium]|jgi:N-acetylglucosamine-6-phosphate deacetylase|nr:N-acetylglucosamine-6-phosphate deacetylase [Opitutaceae bacterium]
MTGTVRLRPSLFDLQVNGFGGVDFQDPGLGAEALHRACRALHAHCTRRIFLTLITDRIGALEEKFARIERLRRADPLAAETIAGYHLEGPYLSPRPGYRGAHPAEHMKAPSLPEFRRLQRAAGGRIRLITLAPEWPGSARFIAAVTAAGVVVSLGHTAATAVQIDAAVRAGARLCTHVGNGCPLELPRHDNIIQRLLARDELIATFIPDGIHVPPPALKNFLRAKPRGGVILTTDAVAAAGAPPGPFHLRQGGRRLRLVAARDGTIACPGRPGYLFGSSLTLDRGVANAARWTGRPAAEAWEWASRRPARLFGIRLPWVPIPGGTSA